MRLQLVSLDFLTKMATRYINGRPVAKAEMTRIDGSDDARRLIEDFRTGALYEDNPTKPRAA